jgi:hypothetical protein
MLAFKTFKAETFELSTKQTLYFGWNFQIKYQVFPTIKVERQSHDANVGLL